MRVAKLDGALLDYWVAQCNPPDRAPGEWHKLVPHSRGATCYYVGRGGDQQAIYAPSSRWEQGGPIIEREGIMLCKEGAVWGAAAGNTCWNPGEESAEESGNITGPTPLIAAMRCYVASKFGEEVQDAQPESVG